MSVECGLQGSARPDSGGATAEACAPSEKFTLPPQTLNGYSTNHSTVPVLTEGLWSVDEPVAPINTCVARETGVSTQRKRKCQQDNQAIAHRQAVV